MRSRVSTCCHLVGSSGSHDTKAKPKTESCLSHLRLDGVSMERSGLNGNRQTDILVYLLPIG